VQGMLDHVTTCDACQGQGATARGLRSTPKSNSPNLMNVQKLSSASRVLERGKSAKSVKYTRRHVQMPRAQAQEHRRLGMRPSMAIKRGARHGAHRGAGRVRSARRGQGASSVLASRTQDDWQRVLAVTHDDHLCVGRRRELLCGFDALPLQQRWRDAL